MITASDLRHLAPLEESSALLGDQRALCERWDRDGYLFFRNVLDPAAIGVVRRKFLDVLGEMGVIARGATEATWNGASLANFPFKIPGLEQSHIWMRLTESPSVNEFFTAALGDAPHWLPMTEYRVTPPGKEDGSDLFMYRHQDGLANQGIPFRVCWLPMSDIGIEAGGLAVASGWHKRSFVHDPGQAPYYPILHETLPLEDWRRSDCAPGDVLMFGTMTPHSGIANRSGVFRLSMDLRVIRNSDPHPIVGEIVAHDAGSITVRDRSGLSTRLGVDAASWVRGRKGVRITPEEFGTELPLGMRVVASFENGVIKGVRPERD